MPTFKEKATALRSQGFFSPGFLAIAEFLEQIAAVIDVGTDGGVAPDTLLTLTGKGIDYKAVDGIHRFYVDGVLIATIDADGLKMPLMASGGTAPSTSGVTMKVIVDEVGRFSFIPDSSGGDAGGALFFLDACNVNHGKFWDPETEYTDCFWEGWVKPITPNTTGYFISDGAGGAHNVLLGVVTGDTDAYVSGNFQSGGVLRSMDAPGTRIPLGDWVHIAFGYNSSRAVLFVNGVSVFYFSFSGTRKTGSGNSNGYLYIGGSFHNNFPGYVRCVRGTENEAAAISYQGISFIERDLGPFILGSNNSTLTRAHFLANYATNGMRLFHDAGAGWKFADSSVDITFPHHGVFARFDTGTGWPTWSADAGEPENSSVIPTPPATPANCLVFDSFSRANSVHMLENIPAIGSTEAGSLGILPWLTTTGAFGILYGFAVGYPAQNQQAVVETGVSDVDVRVTKPSQTSCGAGLAVRVKDSTYYLRVYSELGDSHIVTEFMQNSVQTFDSHTVPANWTILRVTVVGTTLTIYTDGVSRATATVSAAVAGQTKHGLFSGDVVNHFDNFTIFAG